MEIPQARITVFPVFPVDVPSLFPDSGNDLKRFRCSRFSLSAQFPQLLPFLLYRPRTLGTVGTVPEFKEFGNP